MFPNGDIKAAYIFKTESTSNDTSSVLYRSCNGKLIPPSPHTDSIT